MDYHLIVGQTFHIYTLYVILLQVLEKAKAVAVVQWLMCLTCNLEIQV